MTVFSVESPPKAICIHFIQFAIFVTLLFYICNFKTLNSFVGKLALTLESKDWRVSLHPISYY